MADVFDEVEEELRKERYQELFSKWGPWVLGAALAVIVGVAGYQWYDASRTRTAQTAGQSMLDALEAYENGDLAVARANLETLASQSPRGYQALALMQSAAIALETGERDEAVRLFQEAASAAPDRLTRDVARYKALLIEMEQLSYDDVVLRAEPLTDNGGPLTPLARELMGAAALRAERWDEARSHYEQIGFSLDAPQGLQVRASEAIAYIEQRAPQTEDNAGMAPEEAEMPADAPVQEGN